MPEIKRFDYVIYALLLIVIFGLVSYFLFSIMAISGDKFCTTDSDCACGLHISTGTCFYGNANFVNDTGQCASYCSGLSGLVCRNNLCQQT